MRLSAALETGIFPSLFCFVLLGSESVTRRGWQGADLCRVRRHLWSLLLLGATTLQTVARAAAPMEECAACRNLTGRRL